MNGTVLSSNNTRTLTTDDDHVFEKRVYLTLSKLSMTIADAAIDYTDVHVTNGAYLRLTEAGSTIVDYKIGTYTLSFVQVDKNSSIIFDYSSVAVKNVLRKRMFPDRKGILLRAINLLKIAQGGAIHSNYEGYPGSDSGSGIGGYGISGGGGGAYGGVGGQGFSAAGMSLHRINFMFLLGVLRSVCMV